MVQIVLIRPGATDYDQQRRIQGTLDVPLNEQGGAQVARLIEELRGRGMETIYTSAGEPALQTAQAIAKALDIRCKKLDRMQNLDHGLWQGMLIEEVRLRQPKVYRQWQEQPETVCPPQGEMLSQAEDRVSAALTPLLKRHKGGIIGLVVPEPLASVVRHWLKQSELGDLWKTGNEHGQWEALEVEPGAVAHSP
jgi:broad specificity phosphatase PhoE